MIGVFMSKMTSLESGILLEILESKNKMMTDEELTFLYGEEKNFKKALKSIEKKDEVSVFLVSNVPSTVRGIKIIKRGIKRLEKEGLITGNQMMK
jgi:ribosome biogenesis protein Nip4